MRASADNVETEVGYVFPNGTNVLWVKGSDTFVTLGALEDRTAPPIKRNNFTFFGLVNKIRTSPLECGFTEKENAIEVLSGNEFVKTWFRKIGNRAVGE